VHYSLTLGGMQQQPQQIILYTGPKGAEQVEVIIQKDNVRLTLAQIAALFGTQRPAITKHLNNIFKSAELSEDSVCSILEHTANDGKQYQIKSYNLDAIISVGMCFNVWCCRFVE